MKCKSKKYKGDIEWFLDDKAKKPFAYSTIATCDLIKVLYEQYKDLQSVYDHILFDEDAKEIVKGYLDHGVKHLRL